MVLLVVLETLAPLERAVFVLHDVFAFSNPEVARIVGVPSPRYASLATGPGISSPLGAPVRGRPLRPARGHHAVPPRLSWGGPIRLD
ncbi:MAG: sigma factor-like helix-turn-helix DNA-binding protein [Mycobacteriales bacterium]